MDQVKTNPALILIPEQEIKGQIHFLSNQFKFCLSFMYRDQAHSLWNFSEEVAPLFSWLNDGLGFILESNHRYSRRKRKTERAINDRALMKHKGASYLIPSKDVTTDCRGSSVFYKKTKKGFFRGFIFKRPHLFLQQKNGISAENLDLKKMCSRDTVTQIEGFFDRLEKLYYSPVYIFGPKHFFSLKAATSPAFKFYFPTLLN